MKTQGKHFTPQCFNHCGSCKKYRILILLIKKLTEIILNNLICPKLAKKDLNFHKISTIGILNNTVKRDSSH